LRAGLLTLGVGIVLVGVLAYPQGSPLRASTGALTDVHAPLMRALIPIVCLLLVASSLVYGYVAGVFTNHRDVVSGMNETMGTLGSFLVMAFGLALFHYAFQKAKLGPLVAVIGGDIFRQLVPPGPLMLIGMIVLSSLINLLVASPSAKWAMCAPIFVPMFMKAGMSPELSQAVYRVGDATTDVVTPLLFYYPLVMAVARRYQPDMRMGTLGAMMLPYSGAFLLGWSILLSVLWALGFPLGIHGVLRYP
jgi:aminobenzoyl-glutamate transport protein